MLKINGMNKGIVIDHIRAGVGIKIFNYLGLDKADFTVALIMNAPSIKLGSKDLIKIENVINLDLAALGLIDPNITIVIIEDEKIKEKIRLKLPERVEDIIKCKNPRCVTSVETQIPNVFHLANETKGEYSCQYCDDVYTLPGV